MFMESISRCNETAAIACRHFLFVSHPSVHFITRSALDFYDHLERYIYMQDTIYTLVLVAIANNIASKGVSIYVFFFNSFFLLFSGRLQMEEQLLNKIQNKVLVYNSV